MRLDLPGQLWQGTGVSHACSEPTAPVTMRGCMATSYKIIDNDHARVGLWMQDQGAAVYRDGSTCIGLTRNGELVAGTLYDYFNGASIFSNIAVKGPITREWLWFIFYYPFVQLGATVLLGLIPINNYKSRHLAAHFGFTIAAEIPDADPTGSLGVMMLHRDECRFLRRPYGQARPAAAA